MNYNSKALRIDNTGTVIYIGEAATKASESVAMWRIRKLDTTNPISIKWADGNELYDNVWNDRASLTYT